MGASSRRRPLRRFGRHHKVFGWWHLPSIRVLHPGVDPGSSWLLQTNSLGMRDPREFSPTPERGVTRIVLFGDSFTIGEGADVKDRYSNLMEASEPGLEVMNFGLQGSGPDVKYLIYRELGRQFNSELLMLSPHASNITRVLQRFTSFQSPDGGVFLLPKPFFTLTKDGGIELNNVPVPNERIEEGDPRFDYLPHQPGLGRVIKRSRWKYRVASLVNYQPFPEYDDPTGPAWLLMERIIERLIAERAGRRVVLAPLPSWFHVMKPSLANYIPRFAELADRSPDTHFINVLPHFSELPVKRRIECFMSPTDSHYSPTGHRVVADAILAELRDRSLLGISRSTGSSAD